MKTFARMLALAGGYRWSLVASFALALTQTGLSLIPPRLTQQVIDEGIIGGQHDLLYLYGAALIGVGIVRLIVSVGRRLLTGTISLGIEYKLRNGYWRHLISQPFGYFDRWPTGQLMSRGMADIQNVRMFLGYGIVFFTANVFTMVAVTVLLFILDWKLALLSLAFAPFLVAATVRFSRRLQPVLRDVQQKIADVTSAAEENVVGSRIVRIFAREEEEMAKFSARSTAVFEASIAAARLRAIYIPFITFLPNIAVAVLLWFGGRQVIDGEMTLGTLVAFYSYLMMLVFPAQIIGWLTGLGQRAIASGKRVYEIMDAPIEMVEKPAALELPACAAPAPAGVIAPPAAATGNDPAAADGSPAAGPLSTCVCACHGIKGARVLFDDVSFGYADRRVVTDVRLDVPAGSAVALVGHTGCGKTTLTNLVPRFYDVTGGAVLVDGIDVRDLRLESLRSSIGVVTQDPFLFSTTISENIAFGRPEASGDEVREAAGRAQAASFIEALPEGYETVVGERGLTLSGGQRQRIAIARALLMDPRILILDDAMSSVDVETELRIRAALLEVMEGRTTFIIAHRPSTISLAERVVVLDAGRIVEQGTHGELLDTGGLYARMFGAAERTGRTLDLVDAEEPPARDQHVTDPASAPGDD